MKFGRLTLPLLLVMFLGTLGCEKGDTGPTGPAGPPGQDPMLGFASIDAAGGTVHNFGGLSTTAVTVNRIAAGQFEITFTGTYTGVTDVTDIMVLGTLNDADTYSSHIFIHMSDAAASADATTIVVPLNIQFEGTDTDMDFSLVVMSSS